MSLHIPVLTGRYGCPACTSRFESLGDKKRHIRKTHPVKGQTTEEQNR